MQKYIFSADKNAFFPVELKIAYQESGEWPGDGIEIDDTVAAEFMKEAPEGKYRGVIDGMPAWIDIPPPTHEEQIAAAELEKQQLINQVNEYINSKQWPGKAAIGRLKDEELAQYNLWGTVAKLAMRQPFVLFKGLTFQKLCLPGAFRPGDHHN
ncbi:tail fiber assembly protein, partial [Escherichia coli]|nr:tail fiber assembly protein [Escherichia coli]